MGACRKNPVMPSPDGWANISLPRSVFKRLFCGVPIPLSKQEAREVITECMPFFAQSVGHVVTKEEVFKEAKKKFGKVVTQGMVNRVWREVDLPEGLKKGGRRPKKTTG